MPFVSSGFFKFFNIRHSLSEYGWYHSGSFRCSLTVMINQYFNVYNLVLTTYLFIQKEAGIPKKIIKAEEIPGLSKFYNFA